MELTMVMLLVTAMVMGQCNGATNQVDYQVLQSFYKGVENKKALSNWVDTDPCGNNWVSIKCTGASVTALEMNGLGLHGTVTSDLNKLTSLVSVQLQLNNFTGSLPSLSGLSALTTAYLGGNDFDTIPGDFFSGLTSLTEMFIEDSRLNVSQGGWSLPDDVRGLSKLQKLSLRNTQLVGTIPDYLGEMPALKLLYLAYNQLHGTIPASFAASNLMDFQVNNQGGSQQLTGPIDPVAGMESLTVLWLHVNQFTGVIPAGLGNLSSLKDLRLNDNLFVGTIPDSLAQLPALTNLTIKGNRLVGSMPKLGFTYAGDDGFCQPTPGLPCDPRVTALFDFLGAVNGFTSPCTTNWEGNDPCAGKWNGIACSGTGSITSVQLANCQLSGSLSASLANLAGLTVVQLQNNRISGPIPEALAKVPTLKILNLFNNSISAPVPVFAANVLNVTANPLGPATGPSSSSGPGSSPGGDSGSAQGAHKSKRKVPVGLIIGLFLAVAVVAAGVGYYLFCTKRGGRFMRVPSSSAIVVHPREDSSFDKEKGASVVSKADATAGSQRSGPSELRLESESLVIPIDVLRKATNNFNERSILGRGGFGVVYLGELDNGTLVAVKRAEVINKGLSEFQSEIKVLSKVRHKHLVALLGYCVHGHEKLLVYEYMPQGTLSQHLFEYAKYDVKPLTWKQRLSIALDVARGIEYLHSLAHQSFIHRDLKSSNILLDDDLRAKVADFGLVKLAPEGKASIETRVAGTFGYLAPEYAVTGRVTTKVDVYSYGVILMELLTGRRALDASGSEENVHLPMWFRRTKVNFRAVLDPTLDVKDDEELQSMNRVAEMAGYCTLREPYQRPDMCHAVNVLAPMVMRWKPSVDFDQEENGGIDLGLSLSEALSRWQSSDTTTMTDTVSDVPSRPTGFADTFTSGDVR